MRPGCDRPAVARLTFDPVRCELWLDPLPTHAAPVQELCAFHVERLTVPRGWTVDDRRAGPEVVPGPAPAPEPVVEAEVAPEPEPEPVVEAEVAPEPEPEPAPEPEQVVEIEAEAVAEPEPEPVDEAEVREPESEAEPPEEVARPSRERSPERPARRSRGGSPLLERAFAWTGPQQSILTQPRQDDDADDA